MREISGTLEIAQASASATPYIRIYIGGNDYSSRLLSLEHREEAYRDRATIILRNDDRTLDEVDLAGEYFEIGYGHHTGEGDEYSNAPGLWVKSQQFISMEGVLACQLQCEGMWMLLRELRVLIAGNPPAYDVVYAGTHTVYQLMALVLAAADFTLAALGGEDDGIVNNFTPIFDINELPYEAAAAVLYRLICMTKCYLRPQASKTFKVIFPQDADAVNENYYSDQGHYFFEYTEKRNLLIPNSVAVFCNQGEDGNWDSVITGTAEDAGAIAAYAHGGFNGEILQCHQAATISDLTDANNRAAAILTKAKAEVLAGRLLIPHDASVELYDKVAVYDARGA